MSIFFDEPNLALNVVRKRRMFISVAHKVVVAEGGNNKIGPRRSLRTAFAAKHEDATKTRLICSVDIHRYCIFRCISTIKFHDSSRDATKSEQS